MNELDRDGLQDMDYDIMKQVIQCEGKREVWTIVNAYSDPVFRVRIETYEGLAQGLDCLLIRRRKKKIFSSLPCNKWEKQKNYSNQCVFFFISSCLVRSIGFRNTLASI